MEKAARLVLVALVALLVAPVATVQAATRMPIGFFDDSSFRFSAARQENLADAAATGASVIHTTANWASIAPTRPSTPSDGDDPAYRINDLDELVFTSGLHGLRVMINVTGTPKWANGNKTPNRLPTRLSDLTTFTRMLATRYSGRTGHGTVGLWSVWNEPNIELFLAPQYSGQDDRRPRELRQALQGGVRGHQGRQPACEGRDRRDVGARPRQAAQRRQRQRRAGHVREAARQGERPQVRRVGASPVSHVAEPAAAAEGALPERDAVDAAALREAAEDVVPSDGADLDHRVRPRDEARRAEGRHDCEAVGVRQTGADDREERSERADVRVVRLPRLDRQPVAERARGRKRRAQAGVQRLQRASLG